MKHGVLLTVWLLLGAMKILAQSGSNWQQLPSPHQPPEKMFVACGQPTIQLGNQWWQSSNMGLTWQISNNLPQGSLIDNYWVTAETVYYNQSPSCQSTQVILRYFDCQSPNVPYFQHTNTSENCWHSGGSFSGSHTLYDKVLVLGTSSWQYMGQGSTCDSRASLDRGHTWFNVPCDFSQKYYPDTMLTVVGNQVTMHLPGYDQPSIALADLPSVAGEVRGSLYAEGYLFLVKGWYADGLKLLSSADYGQTWAVETLQVKGDFSKMYPNNGQLILETGGGLYYKSAPYQADFTAVWENDPLKPERRIVRQLTTASLSIIALANGEIWLTRDLGQSWSPVDLPKVPQPLYELFHNEEALLFRREYQYYPYYALIADADTAYHSDSDALNTLAYPRFAFTKDSVSYKILGNGSVFRSSDQGQQWDFLSNPDSLSCCTANHIKFDGDTLFMSTGSKKIYYSTDDGQTWTTILLPLFLKDIQFEINGQDWFALEIQDKRVFHSFGGGSAWVDLTPAHFIPEHLTKSGNRLYLLGKTAQSEWSVRFWDAAEKQWETTGNTLQTHAIRSYAAPDFFLLQTTDTVFIRHNTDVWQPWLLPFENPTAWLKQGATVYATTQSDGLWKTSDLPDACARVSDQYAQICQGDSVLFNSQFRHQRGDYTAVFPSTDPMLCDSVACFHLAVSDSLFVVDTAFCAGGQVAVGGAVYVSTGEYSHYFTTLQGCDSIFRLDLTVFPLTPNHYDTATVCTGYGYETPYFGHVFWPSGQYEKQVKDSNGCPFTYYLNLMEFPYHETWRDTFVLFPFTINGETFLEEGIHYQVMLDENDCESFVIYNILQGITKTDTPTPTENTPVLFPNPASTVFFIQMADELLGANTRFVSIQISNQLGELLLEKTFDHLPRTVVEIPLKGDNYLLANGLYFVKITTHGQGTVVKKLMVSKD